MWSLDSVSCSRQVSGDTFWMFCSWCHCLEHQLRQFNLLYTFRILLSKCVTCLLIHHFRLALHYSTWRTVSCDILQLWFAIQWCWHCICAWELLSRSWSWSWSLGAGVLVLRVTVLFTTLVWDWWILNDIEIAPRSAHFQYHGSIKYRNTRDGILIVAPVSGIAQH